MHLVMLQRTKSMYDLVANNTYLETIVILDLFYDATAALSTFELSSHTDVRTGRRTEAYSDRNQLAYYMGIAKRASIEYSRKDK